MDNRAAIQGQLVSIKNVSTHKSVCLTIHVPEEYALKIIDAFGWPTMVAPISIAIARIDLNVNPEKFEAEKLPRKWSDISLCKQAGILCNDPKFFKFLNETRNYNCTTSEDCKEALYEICTINSRKELDTDQSVASVFRGLDNHYRAWLLL
jgi:hypothetical protein